MQAILDQLGGLVLGSVPTVIFFIILVIAYGVLVRRPLEKALAERRARTSGAIDQARAAISASEAKAAEYEAKLRAARSAIFESRQQRLKEWSTQRDAALESARKDSQMRILAAREHVERTGNEAREQLAATVSQLSSHILRVILPQGGNSTEVTQ